LVSKANKNIPAHILILVEITHVSISGRMSC